MLVYLPVLPPRRSTTSDGVPHDVSDGVTHALSDRDTHALYLTSCWSRATHLLFLFSVVMSCAIRCSAASPVLRDVLCDVLCDVE